MPEKPLIVITGTNASGKSSLAIELARKFDGEIVSADSRQVYKGLELGAGKVTSEERALVPHHLLDVANLSENFTLGNFVPLAHTAIAKIHKKDRLPFLVGGTGLYITAIIENYSIPEVAPNLDLRSRLEEKEVGELKEMLNKLDPDTALNVDIRNPRRIIRALEVCIETGQPYSKLRQSNPSEYKNLVLGLSWDRTVLHQKIDERVDKRIHEGMVEEVKQILGKGVPAERLYELGLEYRIITEFLTGLIPSHDEMVTKLKFAIHAFARRQLTWFRKKTYVHWLDTTGNYRAEAAELIERFLNLSANPNE